MIPRRLLGPFFCAQPPIGGLCFNLSNREPRISTDRSSSPGGCGGGRPCRGSGGNESTHVPRRRPHLSRVCEYAAVVGPGKGHCFYRDHYSSRSGVSGVITCGSLQGRRGMAGTVTTAQGRGQRGPRGRGGKPRGAGGEPAGRNQAGFPGPVSTASDFGQNQAGFPAQPRTIKISSSAHWALSVGRWPSFRECMVL